MAQTAVLQSDGPGKARKNPVRAMTSRPAVLSVYEIDFSTANYVTGGEDISNIWDDHPGGVLHINVEQHDTNTAADRRDFAVDYAAQTLVVYDAFNTEETASDQGVVTVTLLVIGLQ